METIEEFLAHAVNLEREAAERFGMLADAMDAAGNQDVGRLFRQLAEYSRMHLTDAKMRCGFRDVPDLKPEQLVWPDLESPEAAAIWAADPMIGRQAALEVARDAEQAGLDYYQQISESASDPEIRRMAKEFAEEEQQHVAELTRWIENPRPGGVAPAKSS